MFAVEGEGGLTAGASHETKNSAFGLGLDNLHYLIDWNNFGIDEMAISEVVNGTPQTWFEPYGFRVHGTENGSDWDGVTRALPRHDAHAEPRPSAEHDLVQDDQGPRLHRHRLQVARNAAQAELRAVLATAQGVRRQVRHPVAGCRPAGAERRGRAARPVRGQPEGDRRHHHQRRRAGRLPGRPAGRARRLGARRPSPSCALDTDRNPWHDKRLWDFRQLPGRALRRSRARASPTAPRSASGAPGSTPSGGRSTVDRCSWPCRPTWPSRPTSPASRRISATSKVGVGTTASTIAKARCCRRRSPSSPTRAIARRHRQRQLLAARRWPTSTASTPRTRPTAPSAT